MSNIPAPVNRKIRRIDKKCPCGGITHLVGQVVSGKEVMGYLCNGCGIFYVKAAAKNFENIYVT